MSNTLVAIVAAEAKHAAEGEPTLEGKLRAAMKCAANHWMVLDPALQQKGALAAVLQLVGLHSEDGLRIQHELKLHNSLAAAASGIPVDFGALLGDEDTEHPEPIGLAKLWQEASQP